jgi:hypothetical protein
VLDWGDSEIKATLVRSECFMSIPEREDARREAEKSSVFIDKPSCREHFGAIIRKYSVKFTEPLAKLALSTRDPAIYNAARHACPPVDGEYCAQLSEREFAELDRENAYAWIVYTSFLAERGNHEATDEAMRRLLTLKNYNKRQLALNKAYSLIRRERGVPREHWTLEFMYSRWQTSEIEAGRLDDYYCKPKVNNPTYNKDICEQWLRLKLRTNQEMYNTHIDPELLAGALGKAVKARQDSQLRKLHGE